MRFPQVVLHVSSQKSVWSSEIPLGNPRRKLAFWNFSRKIVAFLPIIQNGIPCQPGFFIVMRPFYEINLSYSVFHGMFDPLQPYGITYKSLRHLPSRTLRGVREWFSKGELRQYFFLHNPRRSPDAFRIQAGAAESKLAVARTTFKRCRSPAQLSQGRAKERNAERMEELEHGPKRERSMENEKHGRVQECRMQRQTVEAKLLR
ncbi:hypothetical protein [Paucidesulfovibrio longus]|uniref:hypothetical protein n=1 Tax=Paucidesulfovibrio longus TaxID=889 RepID=UPI00138B0CCB|nr:hypothetical protein [Paucidesulfovibrio longus]